MWRQFLDQPWCRARTAMALTALCTQTHQRPDMTDAERAAELINWRNEAETPGFRERLWRFARQDLSKREVQQETRPRPAREAMQGALRWARRIKSKWISPGSLT